MSSGRLNTVGVVGAYWISSISSLRKTTLPGVDGKIAPDLERGLVGHRDAPALRVRDQVRCTLRDRRSAGIQRELQGIGVGREEIRRRDGVDELVGDECQLFLGAWVDLRQLRELANVVGVEQIGVLDQREVGLIAPCLGGETPIPRVRGVRCLAALA